MPSFTAILCAIVPGYYRLRCNRRVNFLRHAQPIGYTRALLVNHAALRLEYAHSGFRYPGLYAAYCLADDMRHGHNPFILSDLAIYYLALSRHRD
jgi:hypothetical protein